MAVSHHGTRPRGAFKSHTDALKRHILLCLIGEIDTSGSRNSAHHHHAMRGVCAGLSCVIPHLGHPTCLMAASGLSPLFQFSLRHERRTETHLVVARRSASTPHLCSPGPPGLAVVSRPFAAGVPLTCRNARRTGPSQVVSYYYMLWHQDLHILNLADS